jgi:hypothetical protein
MKIPKLKKRIFNENDYNEYLWHDNKIYSMIFDDEKNRSRLKLEIDFIIEWVYSKENTNIKTWQVPAILFFNEVFDLKINLKWESYVQCEINNIEKKIRTDSESTDEGFNGFIINIGPMDNGQIILSNVSKFEMHLIGEPQLCNGSYFDVKIRKEIIKKNIDYILDL